MKNYHIAYYKGVKFASGLIFVAYEQFVTFRPIMILSLCFLDDWSHYPFIPGQVLKWIKLISIGNYKKLSFDEIPVYKVKKKNQ